MRTLGSFTLNVEPGSGALPPRVSITLMGAVPRVPALLADRAGIPLKTIQRAESTDGQPIITLRYAQRVQAVLEAAGVEFINGDEPSVKLKARRAD